MGRSAGAPAGLVGRARELEALDALVDGVRSGRGGQLSICGPPGAGRSALIRRVSLADGLLLIAVADPLEVGLPAALLHQLTGPLLHPAPSDPGPGVAMLEALSAELLDDSPDHDRLVQVMSSVLSHIAESRPVLVVVDDLHWADPLSFSVLVSLARQERRWGILVSANRAPVAAGLTARTEELRLRPLDADESRRLVEDLIATRPGFTGRAGLEELIEFTVARSAGNPGVLTRLVAALITGADLSTDGTVDLDRRAAMAVASMWLPPIGLSPQASDLGLLWAVAADFPGQVDGSPVPGHLEPPGARAELLAAGLLVVQEGATLPVHPLLPPAVLELAPSGDQRRAHHVLADALAGADDLRAAWHRAHSTVGSDEELAERLSMLVDRDRLRGPSLLSRDRARVMERAARHSVDASRRDERWSRAALYRLEAGERGVAISRLALVTDDADAASQARCALAEGLIATASRTPEEAFGRLTAAIELAREVDRGIEVRALAAIAELAWWSGRADWVARSAELAELVILPTGGDVPPDEEWSRNDDEILERNIVIETVRGGAAMFGGRLDLAGSHLREAVRLGAAAASASALRMAGQAALLLGDDVHARDYLAGSVQVSRARGDISQLAFTVEILASVETWLGDLGAAEDHLAEGRALSQRLGDTRSSAFQLSISAHVAGLQGDEAAATTAALTALRLVTGHDVGFLPASAVWALGRSDLAQGRFAAALERLRTIVPDDSSRAHPIASLFAVPDLVEAAVRSGRPELARACLPRFTAWAEAGSTWAGAVLPRLRALTAADTEAEAFFEAARYDPERPFENARTQLLHGELLRRARHRVRSRSLLESARRTFTDLGATPWSDRAAAELTATAERARRRDGEGSEGLTAQELAIARLVADGASNQRVAEQLFLSRKTVESHLHKVYTKLGIGSRKQLRDALPAD